MGKEKWRMSEHNLDVMTPSIEALHAARSALTVASGRVALAQRHMARDDSIARVANDLASVPVHLAQIAAAIDRLARAALACEHTDLFANLELAAEPSSSTEAAVCWP
jgi:hypothetical protein